MIYDDGTLKVSVIIPMRNAVGTIQKCLLAMNRQTLRPHEVIIIDNDSSDESLELVQNMANDLIDINLRIGFEEKRGPAAARNAGIALSEGEILAFTDSDCIPEPDWIEKIVQHFKQDVALDVLGGVEKHTPHAISTIGKLMSISWLPHAVESIMVSKEGFFSGQVVPTFNAAARRRTVLDAGGFDSTFKLAGEDADLWFRAFDQGARISVWASDVVVAHKQEISLPTLLRKMFRYGEAEAHLMRRHFSRYFVIRWLRGCNYSVPFPLGTIVIYSILNIFLLFISLFGLLVADILSLRLFSGICIAGFLAFNVITRRRLIAAGYNVSLSEVGLCSLYHIAKRIAEEVGRIYGSLKYYVICI
jgi:glycosyltransferase involved in cell wall biosynthesis